MNQSKYKETIKVFRNSKITPSMFTFLRGLNNLSTHRNKIDGSISSFFMAPYISNDSDKKCHAYGLVDINFIDMEYVHKSGNIQYKEAQYFLTLKGIWFIHLEKKIDYYERNNALCDV